MSLIREDEGHEVIIIAVMVMRIHRDRILF